MASKSWRLKKPVDPFISSLGYQSNFNLGYRLIILTCNPLLNLQTGVPMTGLAVLGAQVRLSSEERRVLQSIYLPWAWRAGCRARDLVSVYYEEYLDVSCRQGAQSILYAQCSYVVAQ